MVHTITITHKSASGNGDIRGKQIACTCGFLATTSLIFCEDAERIGREHVSYMCKKDAKLAKYSTIGVSGYRRS